jgi:phosphatidylglycerol:prolipoprotein diacylglycerol transferase
LPDKEKAIKMYPILIEIGPISVYSYGFMLALTFAICTLLGLSQAKKEGLQGNFVIDLAIVLVLFGITGARLLYVLQNIKYFISNPLEMFMIFKGGLSVYGGIITAFFGGLWFIKWRKEDFWRVADFIAPYIMLGQAIARIGCFLNGCCYGKPTEFFLGVKFPHLSARVHPTELYMSAGAFLFFWLLIFLRSRKHLKGQIFAFYLMFYAILRFNVDFFRGDMGVVFLGMTQSQVFSIAMFIVALILWGQIQKSGRVSDEGA